MSINTAPQSKWLSVFGMACMYFFHSYNPHSLRACLVALLPQNAYNAGHSVIVGRTSWSAYFSNDKAVVWGFSRYFWMLWDPCQITMVKQVAQMIQLKNEIAWRWYIFIALLYAANLWSLIFRSALHNKDKMAENSSVDVYIYLILSMVLG